MPASKAQAYRWQVAARAAAAIFGGYALANIASIGIAQILPMPQKDAVMTALLLSFAIYTGAVLWVFAVRSVLNAWLGLLAPAVLLGGALWFARWLG